MSTHDRTPQDPVSIETAEIEQQLDTLMIATCRECGCDDLHACRMPDGWPCDWIEVDRTTGVGLCSACLHAELERQAPGGRLA